MVQLFDKVGKDTGPGKIASELSGFGSLVCTYILYNFNIDGNTLKPEHKKFLDEHLIPLLRRNPFHAKLTGTASKSGDRKYNEQLSLGRVLRVKYYLRDRGGIPEAKLPGPDIRAAGEDLSVSKSQEDAIDRAVIIIVATGIRPKSTPPIIKPKGVTEKILKPDIKEILKPEPDKPDPNKTDAWEIQQLTGVNISLNGPSKAKVPGLPNVGISGGTVEYQFILRDKARTKMARCRFFGPAASVGGGMGDFFPVPVSGSYTDGSGTWKEFTTPKPVTFDDFNGEAKWTEPISSTTWSATPTLEFLGLKLKIEVPTGTTFGLPASTISPGDFLCWGEVPLDYWPEGR